MAEPKETHTTRPFATVKGSETSAVTKPFRTVPNVLSEDDEPAGSRPKPTEGMLARRRDVERKKRDAKIQQLREEEAASESWIRFKRITAWVVLIMVAVIAYLRVQSKYGDKWPLMAIWISMVIALIGGIFWVLWYTTKKDL